GLNWKHVEFDESFGGQPAGTASKVKGGYNCNTIPFIALDENSGTLPSVLNSEHGMQSAGLIGAMRNNPYSINISPISSCSATNVVRRGVAGIAGGEWCDDINATEKGVSLYDMQVQISPPSGNTFTPASQFAQGYILATQSGNGGLGLHITNHSYGTPPSDPNFGSYSNILKDAIYFMYRSDAVTVISRGNQGDDEHHAPATTVNEEWVLSVGGNGIFNDLSNPSNPNIGAYDTRSSYGKNVDLIAPYDGALIYSLGLGNNAYVDFSGTSAAGPHVAGTAGLLLSYLNHSTNHPNNLNHDDVEQILQLTATDRGVIGYDNNNGWGRLNATAALQFVDKSQYHILHFPELGASTSMTITPTNTIFDFYKPNYLSTQGNKHKLVVQAYEVTITYNHQSYVGNGTFENAWIRNSAAEGYKNTFNLHELDYKWCELVSADNQQAVTKTYLYKIIGYHNSTLQNYTPNPGANYDWWGLPPYSGNIKCPYTLRVSGAITNTQQIEEDNENVLRVYPVPTFNEVTIEFTLEENTNISLDVFDLNGRLIKTVLVGNQTKGKHNVNFSLSELSTGVYFCRLQAGSEVFTQKIVKIN
ncbi:MAG: S8 family serine peptidase, partial [Saprospiraceae bacterium]|nr:S8 family serine peptidase [Saprospiraceae bacterium]